MARKYARHDRRASPCGRWSAGGAGRPSTDERRAQPEPGQRQRVHRPDSLHPGQAGQPLRELPEKRHAPRRRRIAPAGQRHAHRQDARRLETRVHRAQPHETPHQQPRADQHHHRQRHLRDHQDVAHTPRRRARRRHLCRLHSAPPSGSRSNLESPAPSRTECRWPAATARVKPNSRKSSVACANRGTLAGPACASR